MLAVIVRGSNSIMCISLAVVLIAASVLLSPVFGDGLLKYSLEEKSPLHTLVADLSQDLQLRSSASYSLLEFLPIDRHLFAIDNRTGQLTSRSIIDREELCARQQCSCESCTLVFQLLIETSEKLVEKIVEVHIEDRNDHSPTFEHGSIIHIKANVPLGYRIVLPSANDPDEGLNSVQSYRIEGDHADDFDVDFSSINIPYLIVRSPLDRQRISSYALALIASDHGRQPKPRSGSMQLDIRITNDSIPTFQQSVYRIDVREDVSIGTTLLKVEASSETEGKIFYEIVNESPFIIDRLTGQIQVKQLLDYEREKSYRLTIKALENSIPTYAIVFIRVIDINDNAVAIHIRVQGQTTLKQTRNGQNVLFMAEDTRPGTVFAQVFLTDLDSYANGNPYLQLTTIQPPLPFIYKLVYQTSFQNTKLYSLVLNSPLDRETRAIYHHIQILAHDSGTPTLHTRLSLVLNITDVNDCVPRISADSTVFDVNENNPVGLIIGTLNGSDCDLGLNGRFEYRLLNQTDLLAVDAQTGRLTLNQSIDFEQFHPEKHLSTVDLEYWIEIRDEGQPALASQTKVLLRIHDLNDHSPQFDTDRSYAWTFSLSSLRPGSILGRITANDADAGLQGQLHYSIESMDPCFSLNITNLGYVYLLNDLACVPATYSFEITAMDYGSSVSRSTKQLLTINVQSDSTLSASLPRLLSLSTQRTMVDVNSLGSLSFVIDLTHNHSIAPRIYLNESDASTYWNVSSSGEVSLVVQPPSYSSLLTFTLVDDFTEENRAIKLQIDLCNSSTMHPCRYFLADDQQKESQLLLFWAMSLAVIITCLCVVLFSIMTCLCCRRPTKPERSSQNLASFLQCHEDGAHSEKTLQSSLDSAIRDDSEGGSTCVMNKNPSVSSQGQQQDSQSDDYQPSTYFYDLKLAELIRHTQYPPCVHLNPQPCASMSTDYGFGSSELSSSPASSSSASYTSASTLPIREEKVPPSTGYSSIWCVEENADADPSTKKKNYFVSSLECVV